MPVPPEAGYGFPSLRSRTWPSGSKLQGASLFKVIEINPADAAERGIIKSGTWVLVSGPEMASGKAAA
jgi:hypothetical protein